MGRLTDAQIRAIKPRTTICKYTDGEGLFLKVTPAGGMYWQWRIRTPTGETTVQHGSYPKMGLAEARKRHREAQAQRRAGVVNPNELKRQARRAEQLSTEARFEAVAREWFSVRKDDWAPAYAERVIRRLQNDVFPWIGDRPVADISAPELLSVLRRIEGRGVIETAHRALENCSQVFRFAVATGRASSDPGRDLRDALRMPIVRHFPAITDGEELGQLLRAIDGYAGTYVVRSALKLAPMLFLRPGELRHARWSEIDLDRGEWWIPPSRMKATRQEKLNGKPHFVPLATQAIAVLRELQALTGDRPEGYVFRGERHHDRPMSDSTVNAGLRALGYAADKVTGHGFRATARTLLAEELGFRTEVIEAQLAHAVRDANGRAYNRTEFLIERKAMMQRWADFLDQLRVGGRRIPATSQEDPGSDSVWTSSSRSDRRHAVVRAESLTPAG